MSINYLENKEAAEKRHHAFIKATQERKQPCPKCGFHGCVCQLSLKEWLGG